MSGSKATLRERLRHSTRAAHDALERAVRIGDRIATRAGYVGHLEQLFVLHSAAERGLDRFDFTPLGFTYRWPNRSALLAADLLALGVPAVRLRTLNFPDAPQLGGMAGALGSLYVLEGSAKGARAILPSISASLGLDAVSGASFFSGFGAETKRVWQSCVAAINAIDPDSADGDRAVAGALATFAMFHQGLQTDSGLTQPVSRHRGREMELLDP